MTATATQEIPMTPTTATCINCHATAPKFTKGLCQPCYGYQRRHGGARPFMTQDEADTLRQKVDQERATMAALQQKVPPVEPPPVDPQGDTTPTVNPAPKASKKGALTLVPTTPPVVDPPAELPTDVPQVVDPHADMTPPSTNDPHAAALDAIMQLAAEGRGAVLAKLEDGTLRWKAPRVAREKAPKGGAPKGKMADDQVRALRAERDAGASYGTLATKYQISPMGARAIALRETYKSVV